MRKIIMHAGRFWSVLSELLKQSRFYRYSTIISALLVIGSFALLLWQVAPVISESRYIPLHYNIYFGVDRFGPWYNAFFLPGIGAILLIVNIIFEVFFIKREHVLSAFFAVGTFFSELIIFVATVLMLLLK